RGWLPATLSKAEWSVLDAVSDLTGEIARLPVPLPLEAGVKDLGTLVLARPPLLVGGICVDRGGQPLPDAQVSLVTLPWVEPRPGEMPKPLPDGVIKSQSGGRFAYRGAVAGENLRLRAWSPGRVPSPLVAFARGASDV